MIAMIEPLPQEEWIIHVFDSYMAVAAHTSGGGLYWTKIELDDFPYKTDIGINELPKIIADIVNRKRKVTKYG